MTTTRENNNVQVSNDIFDAIEKLRSGEIISLPNYQTKNGEIANYRINGAINYGRIKKDQNTALHGCTEAVLTEVASELNISIEIVRTALNELKTASDKNLSKNVEDRTPQAQVMAEIYINFGKGFKMNIESKDFHIDGLVLSKTNVRNRQPYKVPKFDKTKAKRLIEKKLNFKSMKYGSFIVGSSEFINMSGMTVTTDV